MFIYCDPWKKVDFHIEITHQYLRLWSNLKFEFLPFYFVFYEFANQNIIWKITLAVTLFKYCLRISRSLAFTAQTKPLDHDTLKPRDRESPPWKTTFSCSINFITKTFFLIYISDTRLLFGLWKGEPPNILWLVPFWPFGSVAHYSLYQLYYFQERKIW